MDEQTLDWRGKYPLKIVLGKSLHFSNLPRNATCMSRGWQVEKQKT